MLLQEGRKGRTGVAEETILSILNLLYDEDYTKEKKREGEQLLLSFSKSSLGSGAFIKPHFSDRILWKKL